MIVRAKYALIAPGEVRRDVRLEIDGERIVDVRCGFAPSRLRPDYNLGDAVITAGLVNPHTHLELEFCDGQVRNSGSFVDWLQEVRDRKAARGNVATTYPERTLRGLSAGGCTTVVDHHTGDMDWEAIASHGLRYVPMREFFQFDNHEPSLELLRSQARLGFAPHAPYTASLEVAKACRELSDEAMVPMSVHLSEIAAEVQFIESGQCDEIEMLLKRANAWDPAWRGTGKSPIRYFAENGLLNAATYCIHMNYLTEGDLEILSALRPTVVFCPATHAYFGHPAHPIESYLRAGVPVAIGTDSLASNSCISPLAEAKLVRARYPQIPAADVLAGITTRPLSPLGWEAKLGQLEAGRLADLACFKLDGDPGTAEHKDELFAAVFDALIATGQSCLTVVGGRVVHDAVSDPAEAEAA